MAKAKKRVAARKGSSKRGKASAKPARKLTAKRAMPKKVRAKVRRAKKPAAKQKHRPATVDRGQAAEMPVETTIIDAIEEPAGVVVAAAEHESVQTAASIPPGGELEHGETIGPAGTPT
jgi:hypothetical protein